MKSKNGARPWYIKHAAWLGVIAMVFLITGCKGEAPSFSETSENTATTAGITGESKSASNTAGESIGKTGTSSGSTASRTASKTGSSNAGTTKTAGTTSTTAKQFKGEGALFDNLKLAVTGSNPSKPPAQPSPSYVHPGYKTEIYSDGGFYEPFDGGVNPELWYIGWTQWGGANANGGVIPDNVSYTEDGILILTGNGKYYEGPIRGIDSNRLRRPNGKYTGAAIITNRPLGPGKYEVRMKVLPRLGACNAMWTYFSDPGRNHEIDIEIPGNTSTFNLGAFSTWVTTMKGTTKKIAAASPHNDGQWHTYRFDWHTNPKKVVFYVDGVEVMTDTANVPTVHGHFWIGVWFPTQPAWNGEADFDIGYMMVDWARYTPFDQTGSEKVNKEFTQQGLERHYPKKPVALPEINYVSNPGFEVSSEAWKYNGNASIVSDAGSSSSRAANVTSGTMTQTISAINAGLSYTFQADGMVVKGGTATIKIEYLDFNGTRTLGETELTFTESKYKTKTITFTPPTNTGKVRLTLQYSK